MGMLRKLTKEEEITNKATQKHISVVQMLMLDVLEVLAHRASYHDASKMRDPELPMFVEFTSKLKTMTYGSTEYHDTLKKMPALAHHYERNSHHPEYYEQGIDGMTLIDLIEMFLDWKAATMRHDDGDLANSLKHNKGRFNISDQLIQILENTASLLWGGV